jgi:hypothetical protein
MATKSVKNRIYFAGGQAIQKELQSTIAYSCFEELNRCADSLTALQQADLVHKLFYNGQGQSQEDSISHSEQCLKGLGQFAGLFDKEAISNCDNSVTVDRAAPYALVLKPSLHCLSGDRRVVCNGHGGISKDVLWHKSLSSNKRETVSPKTLCDNAKEVLRNCKKALALVKAPASPYRDGDLPSGQRIEDYWLWVRKSMHLVTTCKIVESYKCFVIPACRVTVGTCKNASAMIYSHIICTCCVAHLETKMRLTKTVLYFLQHNVRGIH